MEIKSTNMGKYAIALMFNDYYLKGAETLLYTFLKYNDWFKGDIIIYSSIFNQLSDSSRNELNTLFHNIVYKHIEEKQYLPIIDKFRKIEPTQERYLYDFLKFDVFNNADYDRILFLDADMLCFGSMEYLFTMPEKDYLLALSQDGTEMRFENGVLKDEAVNTGCFVCFKKSLSEKFFNSLMDFTLKFEPTGQWNGKFCEQDVLNVFVRNKKCFLLSGEYNCPTYHLVMHYHDINTLKIVHYWGVKPWDPNIKMHLDKVNVPPLTSLYELWSNIYNQFMEFKNTTLKSGMKTLVCAIGRLENNYIREWVEHYKNIGFTNICLYDNNRDEEENFNSVIKDYIDSGYVILKNFRDKANCQAEAYNDCYETYSSDYDWIAFFDCDEFLSIHNGLKISDILSKEIYNNYDVVCPCWQNFDDNGLVDVTDGNYSISRFTNPIEKDSDVHKSIIRGRLNNVSFNVSYGAFGNGLKACNTAGESIEYEHENHIISTKPSHEYMQLNHYRYKTIGEFAKKVLRGYPDDNTEPINTVAFFGYNKETMDKLICYRRFMDLAKSDLTAAVCCVAKNENKYIHEWVEHYKNIGFDKIYLYDNNDIYGERFEDSINDFIQSGFVEVIDCRGQKKVQLDVYQDCYDNHKEDYDWIAFFDCDEFLHFSHGDTMRTFMRYNFLANYDMVHVNWLVYGDNDRLSIDPNSVQKQLTTYLPIDIRVKPKEVLYNSHIKSIVRGKGNTNDVEWVATPHSPYKFAGHCCNLLGMDVPAGAAFANISVRGGFLSHYQFKTVDDVINKLNRGYPDQVIKDANKWFQEITTSFFICNKKTKEKIDILNDWAKEYSEKHNITITPLFMNDIKVSVIIPCENKGKYISNAIKSVKKQTYEQIECIIVDNGSVDNSEQMIMENIRGDKRFKYIYQEKTTESEVKNIGIRLSTGHYIIVLDPEDCLLADYISDAVHVIEKDSTISLICPDFIRYGEQGTDGVSLTYTSYEDELKQELIPNASMFSRAVYDNIGGYSPLAIKSSNWDFWVRLLKNNTPKKLNKTEFLYNDTPYRQWPHEKYQPIDIVTEIMTNNKALYEEHGLRMTAPVQI